MHKYLKFLPVITLLMTFNVFGQREIKKVRPINQPSYDQKPIHFGFSLGVSSYAFNVEPLDNLAGRDSVYTILSKPAKGYFIGIISDLRLSKRLNLRFIPTLSYTLRTLEYTIQFPSSGTTEVRTRSVESTFVDFPFSLKYKSDRFGNGRAYVLGGCKFSIDMASQQEVEDEEVFKLRSADLYYELGIGTDFYFEFFKLSPEIKVSVGVRDMLVDDNPLYTSGIRKLSSRCILFSLNFE